MTGCIPLVPLPSSCLNVAGGTMPGHRTDTVWLWPPPSNISAEARMWIPSDKAVAAQHSRASFFFLAPCPSGELCHQYHDACTGYGHCI